MHVSESSNSYVQRHRMVGCVTVEFCSGTIVSLARNGRPPFCNVSESVYFLSFWILFLSPRDVVKPTNRAGLGQCVLIVLVTTM